MKAKFSKSDKKKFLVMSVALLPQEILAPFVTDYNPETDEFIAVIPKEIENHLNDPNYCESISENVPAVAHFNLIPTHAVGNDADISTEKLIEMQFSGPKWEDQVRKLLTDKGLVQNNKETNEDAPQFSRYGRDDNLYTVRVENLPDLQSKDELEDILYESGCHYFTKVILPYDEETQSYRRTAFIKFDKLRWALKFIQDYPSIRIKNMLLSFKLSA